MQKDSELKIGNIENPAEEIYSANPEEAKKICNKYITMEITECKDNDKFIEDFYPDSALKICKSFVDLYTDKKGKLHKAVLCVAKCLTEEEKKDRAHICCSKRNSERLYSHIKCYMECNFFPTKLPEGADKVGFRSLLPDAIAESPPVKATVEYARREGKAISDGLKNNPNNAKYTLPGYF